MNPALKLEKLVKFYGDKEVVKGVSLEIKQGEIVGLLGPNGAGKSTTINMITGVTQITSGTVTVFGHDNREEYILTRRTIGVMHQEIIVDTFFNIEDALAIHSGYYGVPDNKPWREELIERLALGPHLKKSMNRLSGGMKRRFMVAKALIHKPRLLILDEPTAGVDVELRQQLWEFVRELNEQRGTTVLLTTHYLEEAEEMCERVAIMNHGEIIALDRTGSLLEKLDEKRLVLHLERNISSVPEILNRFECVLEAEGTKLTLKVTKDIPAAIVLNAVTKADLPIREIETRAPTLQEAFLKLTAGTYGGRYATRR